MSFHNTLEPFTFRSPFHIHKCYIIKGINPENISDREFQTVVLHLYKIFLWITDILELPSMRFCDVILLHINSTDNTSTVTVFLGGSLRYNNIVFYLDNRNGGQYPSIIKHLCHSDFLPISPNISYLNCLLLFNLYIHTGRKLKLH